MLVKQKVEEKKRSHYLGDEIGEEAFDQTTFEFVDYISVRTQIVKEAEAKARVLLTLANKIRVTIPQL